MASHSFIDQSDSGLTGSVFDLKVNDNTHGAAGLALDRSRSTSPHRSGENSPTLATMKGPVFRTGSLPRSFIGHDVASGKRLRDSGSSSTARRSIWFFNTS